VKKLALAAAALGIFTGLGGASHGPGEILQGNNAPESVIIQAWPTLTELQGEPAITIIPNYLVSGIITIIVGVAMAVWAWKFTTHKLGGPILIAFSLLLLAFGGGQTPPLFGFTAGFLAMISFRREHKREEYL
jgi:hypothetical protein